MLIGFINQSADITGSPHLVTGAQAPKSFPPMPWRTRGQGARARKVKGEGRGGRSGGRACEEFRDKWRVSLMLMMLMMLIATI